MYYKNKKPSYKNKTAKPDTTNSNANEQYPHFRFYRKANHPALITAEHSEEEYKYRKVMHGEKDTRHINDIITPNPKPGDTKPMYIGKRVRHDKKNHFGKKLPWKYPSNENKKK